MSEQNKPCAQETPPGPMGMTLAIAVLLYVGLYLWGIIQGVTEMARRESPA